MMLSESVTPQGNAFRKTQAVLIALAALIVCLAAYFQYAHNASAATLTSVSAIMSNTAPSSTTNFEFTFTLASQLRATTGQGLAANCSAAAACYMVEFTFPTTSTAGCGDASICNPFYVSTSTYATTTSPDVTRTLNPDTANITIWYVTTTVSSASVSTTRPDILRVFLRTTGPSPINTSTIVTLTFFNNKFTTPRKYAAAGTADTWPLVYTTYDALQPPNTTTTRDTGATSVAIDEATTLSATVNAALTFQVLGVATSTSVDTGLTTDVSSTAVTCPFGTLTPFSAKVCAQQIQYSTTAANGAIVYVVQSGNMSDSTGDSIVQFNNGTRLSPASAYIWTSPSSTSSDTNTWGHLGYRSNDGVFTSSGTFAGILTRPSASTAPDTILAANSNAELAKVTGPTGATVSQYAIYKIETSPWLPAGSYSNSIAYQIVGTF